VLQVRSVKADLEACKDHMVKEREEHEQALRRTEEEWAAKTASLQEEANAVAEATQKDHEAQIAVLAQVHKPKSCLRAQVFIRFLTRRLVNVTIYARPRSACKSR
jgi:hypothetical protein